MPQEPKAGGHTTATLYDLMIRMFVSAEHREKAITASLKDLIRAVDKRGEERAAAQDKAIQAALAAAEKAVQAALTAQKDAVAEAAENMKIWRDSANEWRGAMNDRETDFMKKDDGERRLASLEKFQSEAIGARLAGEKTTHSTQWMVTIVVALLGILAGGVIAYLSRAH